MQLFSCSDPEFYDLWHELIRASAGLNALYQPSSLLYYENLYSPIRTEDVSFIVSSNGTPVCGIKAFLHTKSDSSKELSCFGLPILYLEAHTDDLISLAASRRFFKKHFESLVRSLDSSLSVRFKDELIDNNLSNISRLLLEMGGQSLHEYSQFLDLRLSESILHSQLTKSNRWSINWAKKNLSIKVLDSNNICIDDIHQFRELHFKEAGRRTRSLESWILQYDMVRSNEAFCVFAYLNHSLVSAALFVCSKTHCYYGVSASVRDHFDKPLGHGVIWKAILHAKSLGITSFELGNQVFASPQVSKKELGISFFKRSFGGTTKVFLSIDLVSSLPSN